MNSPHIVRKSTSPVSAPPEAGIHWINTVTGEEYFSVATSSVNDWIIRKNNGTWLNGSGVPSAGLGNDNDNYIDNVTGNYYKKVSGSWVLQGNLQGPAGATGATGATGPAGANGAPGSQIYTGAGVPSPLLGVNGDFYVDNAGSAYYHKAAGAWVMQGSFGGVTDHGALTGLADNDHPQYLLVSNFNNQNLAMKEPTGFPNRTDSSISFDDMTRTLFISATGAQFDIWVKGTNYVFPSMLAIGKQISTIAGNHYIYFDSTGTLQETTTFNVSLFQDNAMVAIVYWNSDTGTHTYLGDERHGMQMDGATHGYLHTVFGTRYLTGLALQGFTADGDGSSNSHAQFTSDSGTIRDEDILLSIIAQAQIPILFRQGSLWRKKAADSYPIIYNGTAGYAGTRIPFNEFVTGNWQLTEIVNGNYVLIHFFATNDQDNPVIGILGTNQYTNAPQARAACESEISSLAGLPFAEFTAIGSVIFQSNSAYTNVPKARVVSSNPTISEIYVDFRGEQLYTPSGVATSHSLLSNLTSDDHLQYHTDARGDARYLQLTGGTVTGQTVISGASSLGQSLVRITNTGAGDTFVVEDSANPDTSNFKIDSNGFIFTGSLLSTSGVSGRMQILDLSNAFIECKAGSTRAVSFGASTTGNGFRSSLGPLDISTTDSGDAITISPVQGDGFGSSIYTTSNGSMLVTGINNVAPTEALDVTGNIKVSNSVLSPTVKADLIQNKTSVPLNINTTEPTAGAGTQDLTIKSGNTVGASGYVYFLSGDGDSSGNVTVKTGAGNSISSGTLELKSGNTSAGVSGNIDIRTGDNLTGDSGDVNISTGIPGASATRGKIQFDSPNINFSGWSIKNIGNPSNATDGANKDYVDTGLNTKQDTLVSGTNIKTVNGTSLLGSGDILTGLSKGGFGYITAVPATATPSAIGVAAPSVTGTASAVTPNGTTFYTSKKILEYTATAISNAVCGWRYITEFYNLGASPNAGGFKFWTVFGFADGFATATPTARRFFCGFTDSTVAPTDLNPSTLTSMFGFGLDTNDTQIQFMHNDASGAATKIPLGASFPRPTANKDRLYLAEIHSVSNSFVITYQLTDLVTGAVASGSVNTNIPGGADLISPRLWMSAGGVSSSVGVAMQSIYTEQ